ncbi:hypothetical protein HCI99_04490 [Listeria booriae]|uniref:Uncharacterized protein n=1 Tax=Listeria booriae TaxID=1552123 RepID=A0A7X1CBD3_9LIST|nr:hypothetical protein [Listeria booriae]MBC1491010.1 hypothetical protein [Listeria booriae]MBC1491075.1 hypothetical protein [Listeria booriae]
MNSMVLEGFIGALGCISGGSMIQIAYNALVYKHKGKKRWVWFGSVTVIVVVLLYGLFFGVHTVLSLPYVRALARLVDVIVFAFIGYLPKWQLFYWFIVPLLVAWAYYLGITLLHASGNRKRYTKWVRHKEAQEQAELEEEIRNSEQSQPLQTENIKGEESSNHIVIPSDIGFAPVDCTSVLGIQKAYERAKKQGLQLAPINDGYIAIYANSLGFEALQGILNNNNVRCDIDSSPSVVILTPEGIRHMPVKEAQKKINRGESID